MTANDEHDPREPRGIPKELVAVWRRHRKKADEYEMDHAYGAGERYYNLFKKHEGICDAIESIASVRKHRKRYDALSRRVNDLPCDFDENGSLIHVMEAVRKLKSDMAIGEL